ncbi:MAG: AAA family ATPase [Neisseriaceae bacterium]|nr:AAA family ATPase [Neisseriaceae bacterium]
MKRHIIHQLIQWKNSPQRKPLLLTGVRQCGKTHILKELGNAQFEDMCYINFESNQNYAMIFDYDFNVERIIKEIELLQVPIFQGA